MFYRVVWLMLMVSCGTSHFNAPVQDTADGSKDKYERSAPDEIEASSLENSYVQSKQRISWHFPCEEGDTWSWGEHDFIGQGVYSKNMRSAKTLELSISGVLCDTGYLPRDVVFVIDTSASMQHNDPVAPDGSCARSRAMDRMVNYLSRFDNARVGLVTYNSYVSVMHEQLVPAADFYRDYTAMHDRMQEFLCHANYYTNYRRALLQTEKLLKTGRTNSFREIYFFSDGEPMESIFSFENPDGLYVAKRLRKYATIATVGLGKTGILKRDIASRVDGVNHCIVKQNAWANSSLCLRELVQTKNIGAELTYRYLGTDESYTIDIRQGDRRD